MAKSKAARKSFPRGGHARPVTQLRRNWRVVDVRGHRRRQPSSAIGDDVRYARRAAALLSRRDPAADYVVTDVAAAGAGPARRVVVFFQQRVLGLPVYDSRRSVVFRGRRGFITGRRVPISSINRRVPDLSPEMAVRAALRGVYRAEPTVQQVETVASTERLSTFQVGERGRATSHLAVFKAAQARLAWVVDVVDPGLPRYEAVVDAARGTLLRRHPTSQSFTSELSIAPEPTRPLLMPFLPAWLQRPMPCSFNHAGWAPPAPTANGVVAAADRAGQHLLNAFSLANHLLDVIGRYLQVAVQMRFELFSQVFASVGDAAFADADRVVLSGLAGRPNRYAAVDPTVVAHEASHVVLNTVVGGSAYATPFEHRGRSRAVSEGLADYLGLTVWNDVCITTQPPEPTWGKVAPWFLTGGRDYRQHYAGNAIRIPNPQTEHEAGQAVCGALLVARRRVAAAAGSDRIADDAVWRVLLHALLTLPHQGELPWFCCIRRAVVGAAAGGPTQPMFSSAFDDMGLPANCPHVR